MLRPFFALLMVCAGLSWRSSAEAQWSQQAVARALQVGPFTACGDDEPAVTAEVAARLSTGIPPDLTLQLTRMGESGVQLRVRRGARTRERVFPSLPSSCAEARLVVALAVVLAIENSASEPTQPPQPSPRELSIAAAGSVGLLHAPSAGFLAGAGANFDPWWSARLGLLLQAGEAELPRGVGESRLLMLAALPELCAGANLSARLRLEGCLGTALGSLRARGQGLRSSTQEHALYASALLGGRLRFEAGIPWLLALYGSLPLSSPDLAAEDQQGRPVTRQGAPLGLLLAFGPAWLF